MKREDLRVLIAHAVCCGGLLLVFLVAAYGAALAGIVRDNALLIVLSLAGLAAGATVLLSRRRARPGGAEDACASPQGADHDQKDPLTQGRQSPDHF